MKHLGTVVMYDGKRMEEEKEEGQENQLSLPATEIKQRVGVTKMVEQGKHISYMGIHRPRELPLKRTGLEQQIDLNLEFSVASSSP